VDNDPSVFDFSIISGNKSRVHKNGIIILVENVSNIVQFEIGRFNIPYVSSVNDIFNKVRLRLNNFSSDIIESYDFPHHWEFDTVYNVENGITKNIGLTPCNKIYKFKRPISELNKFSFTFGDPFLPIDFYKDRTIVTNIDYTKEVFQIEFNGDYNLLSGDFVTITNFNTLNPAKDYELIKSINRVEGHRITRVNNMIINIDQIQINQITSPDPNMAFNVFFNNRRITFNVKITYMYSES